MSYNDDSNSGASSSHLIPLELSDELKHEAIVTSFEKDTRTGSLLLSLNHKYNKKNIIFPIPSIKKLDWAIFIEKTAKTLRTNGVSPDHILMIEDVLNSNYETVLREVENSPHTNSQDNKKETYYIRKYTANDTLPLHESVVFTDSGQAVFVYLDRDDGGKLKIVNYIERPDKILYPADSLDSQNPLPYTFASKEELEMYIKSAKQETFDSLYQKVKSNLRRYVSADEHYLVVIASDIILSYFQDKFATMHYDIFVGDNGSGKNSALLVISRLAYRVFYLVSASAPNYFTFYGNVEECQGTTAEDEVSDLDIDIHKQKILKSGYTSGGTVPKIDFPNGKRSQAPFNVYGMKWMAMEERPDSTKTKGIFDRSFLFNFVVGHVDYNIKDVIKNGGDPKFKPLLDELVQLHKLLFAFRLIHHNDTMPDIQINLENRNAELTKPSLRLFSCRNDAPATVEEIQLALSIFIKEKNELKSNSIESKLHTVIDNLVRDRNENPTAEHYEGLDDYAFTNDQIWAKCRLVMDGIDILGKSESFYSIDYGKVTHSKISSLFQSKFKAKSFKTDGNNSKRGWRFQKEVLERIGSQYECEDEIRILSEDERQSNNDSDKDKSASDASLASGFKSSSGIFHKNTMDAPPDPDENSAEICGSAAKDSTRIPSTTTNNNNIDSDQLDSKNNGPSLTHGLPIAPTNTNQVKYPYTPQKSDASDASDAPHTKAKSKAEQTGKPILPCIYCSFSDCIEFDLSLHYIEKHRPNLIRLPIGKASIDDRADYAVELSKKKLFESLDENDDAENESDDD